MTLSSRFEVFRARLATHRHPRHVVTRERDVHVGQELANLAHEVEHLLRAAVRVLHWAVQLGHLAVSLELERECLVLRAGSGGKVSRGKQETQPGKKKRKVRNQSDAPGSKSRCQTGSSRAAGRGSKA